MRPVPQQAVSLVSRWEGLELNAYPDPASGGEPITIGWGHTDPGRIKLGDTITAAQATSLLQADLAKAVALIAARIGPVINDLTQNQLAALASFVHNLGADPKWTIWKRLKARQFDQVPGELIKFVNAAGKKNQGLVNRRTDEIRMWSLDEPGSEDVRFTSGALRLMDTPPAVSDPVPAAKSVSLWSKLLGALGMIWAAIMSALQQAPDWIKHALEVVNPFSTQSTIVQHMVAGLATGAAVIGVVNLWFDAKKKKEARS